MSNPSSKKSIFIIFAAVAACILAVWAVFQGQGGNHDEALTKKFLTEIYQVNDHARIEKIQARMEEWRRSVSPSAPAGIQQIPEEVYSDYVALYQPMTTLGGYEQITKNADTTYADLFAVENGYLFHVQDVTLKEDVITETHKQYWYTMSIKAISEKDGSSTDITSEGKITLAKDESGAFLVDTFNPLNRRGYEKLKA
ncbi:MAG: hypothetical protein RR528_04455 [Angelakisella sp.]